MRFMLMFLGGADDDELSEDARAAMYRDCEAWFREHGAAGRVVGGYHLAPPARAVTLHRDGSVLRQVGGAAVDGPLAFGGCAILDVADVEEAIDVAGRWPGRNPSFELRPVES